MSEVRYCTKCGRVLEVLERKIKFNENTGLPDRIVTLEQCKEFAHKPQSFFDNGHDRRFFTIDLVVEKDHEKVS